MIGKKIRNYQIEELIGEGGMGVVYRARDLSLNRNVAIKMLHPEMLHQPDLLKRFKNEAHVTARLSHPNIATLYSFFSEGNTHCLIMEYVTGKTLEEILLCHKKLPETECIKIIQQLLEGLQEAHANGILHRDIKPGNIMVNHAGYVKLMDFGVARFENSARMTRMNRVIGTLEYMAPELLTGSKPSAAADLYSAGVVAYEMLTGSLPFTGDNDADITEKILKGHYSFSGVKNLNIAGRKPKLEKIICKLMHKNSSRRYKDTTEALSDLAETGISGRASSLLLLSEKLAAKADTNHKISDFAGWQNNLAQVKNEWVKLSAFLKPALTRFFASVEGKIITAAGCIALFIVLISYAFTDSSGDTHQPETDAGGLQDAISLNTDINDERLLAGTSARGNERGFTAGEERQNTGSLFAPEPVVNRRNTSSEPSERNTGNSEESTPREGRNSQIGSGDNSSGQQAPGGDRASSEETRVNSQEDHAANTRNSTPEVGLENEQVSENSAPPARTVAVSVSGVPVVGIFEDSVSTLTHKTGDSFFLAAAGPVYSGGYKVIETGARIRGIVTNIRDRGNSRRATLAVEFKEIQAVDGSWLPISYPEYSNQATGSVTFEKGRTVNRLLIESGTVSIQIN